MSPRKNAADLNRQLRSVPLGEDDQLAQKNEGEAALQKAAEDEMNPKCSASGRILTENGRGEASRLVRRLEDEDDTNHAFAEAVRKDKGFASGSPPALK